MSEFRAALQALVDSLNDMDISGFAYRIDQFSECFSRAKALLARPERINRPETGDGFTQRMQAERLENASNRRYPAPPKDPQPGEYEPGDGAPPQSEPEPRITREEAEKLLDKYVGASIDQWSRPMSEDGLYKQASAFEACLEAMLRPEPGAAEKVRPEPESTPCWVHPAPDAAAPMSPGKTFTAVVTYTGMPAVRPPASDAEKAATPRMKPRTVPLDEDEKAQESQVIADLAMMMRQIVYALNKAIPDTSVAYRAMKLLEKHGLQGSVLRDASPPAASDGEKA